MIDIKILRDNPELVVETCKRRKHDAVDVMALHAKDAEYRKLQEDGLQIDPTHDRVIDFPKYRLG